MDTFTAFDNDSQIAAGTLGEIGLFLHGRGDATGILVFSDQTGRSIDLDLRGTAADIRARYAQETRGRGRPKLGVTGREITLLPRHWDWLNAQSGGASVALRKLVETAMKTAGGTRQRRDAVYHFITVMAGNRPHYEEAVRALYADDEARMFALMADWPQAIVAHCRVLLQPVHSA